MSVWTLAFLSYGQAAGQSQTVAAICTDTAGFVYTAEDQDNRSQKFDGTTGVFSLQVNNTGTDQFDVAISPLNGHVFVCDHGLFRVSEWTQAGASVRAIGSHGVGNGQFQDVVSIGLDGSGNLYAWDVTRQITQKFNSAGVYQATVAIGLAAAKQWAVSWTGEFFKSDGNYYDATGTLIKALRDGNNQLISAQYVYIPPVSSTSHVFYITNPDSGATVWKFTQTGTWVATYTNVFIPTVPGVTGNTGFKGALEPRDPQPTDPPAAISAAENMAWHSYAPTFAIDPTETYLWLNNGDVSNIYKFPLTPGGPAMAVVVTPDTPVDKGSTWVGGQYVKRGTVALGSYVTGGVPVTRATFGINVSLDDLDIRTGGGFVPEWDRTNAKVLVYRQTAATSALIEVPNATDLSAVNFRYRASGK